MRSASIVSWSEMVALMRSVNVSARPSTRSRSAPEPESPSVFANVRAIANCFEIASISIFKAETCLPKSSPRDALAERVDALGQFPRAIGELLQVGRFATEADIAADGLQFDRRSGDFARFPLQLGKRPGVRERGGDPAAADEIDAPDDDKSGDEGDADKCDADLDRQEIAGKSHVPTPSGSIGMKYRCDVLT